MSEPLIIEFTFYGQQYTAGSKQTFPVVDKKTGQVVRTKSGRLLTRAKHANPKTELWMAQVASESAKAYQGPLLTGAIKLTIVFIRPRPQGHYGTGRNEGKLKESAPPFLTTTPDTLKLGRAIEDACTGILWVDDSQIVHHTLTKQFGSRYTTTVRVESLDGRTRED